LAEFLYEEIELQNIKVRKDKSDNDSDKEEKFTVLTKTLCPAVLTENMFMDSKKDVEFLTSEEGIKKLLTAHVIGIRRYFEDINGTHESWISNNLYNSELC
jgi:N-acetylmuramoyl-L-alanine amidase